MAENRRENRYNPGTDPFWIAIADCREFAMKHRFLLLGLGLVALLAGSPNKGRGQQPTKDPGADELFLKQAVDSFKAQDANGDGYLDKDEMSANLRRNLEKFDKNRDGLISFPEYLEYRRSQIQPTPPMPPPQPMPEPKPMPKSPPPPPEIIIIDEGELEKRPNVPRAGNLPKGLPPWFDALDMDGDGQIALWEWRKGGKNLNDFQLWDRNDDGLITIEEVLYRLEMERLAAKKVGKALPVGAGLEFRETMENGMVSVYLVKLERGKVYQIDMITPTPQQLDPFLFLEDKDGKVVAQDDDSGGQLNARILYRANATGNYRILAASVGNRGNGEYTLQIRAKEQGK